MFDLNWVFVLVDELKCGRGLSGFFQGKSSEAQAGPRFVAAGTNTCLIFFVYEYRVGACIHNVYRYIPGSCMLQGTLATVYRGKFHCLPSTTKVRGK